MLYASERWQRVWAQLTDYTVSNKSLLLLLWILIPKPMRVLGWSKQLKDGKWYFPTDIEKAACRSNVKRMGMGQFKWRAFPSQMLIMAVGVSIYFVCIVSNVLSKATAISYNHLQQGAVLIAWILIEVSIILLLKGGQSREKLHTAVKGYIHIFETLVLRDCPETYMWWSQDNAKTLEWQNLSFNQHVMQFITIKPLWSSKSTRMQRWGCLSEASDQQVPYPSKCQGWFHTCMISSMASGVSAIAARKTCSYICFRAGYSQLLHRIEAWCLWGYKWALHQKGWRLLTAYDA